MRNTKILELSLFFVVVYILADYLAHRRTNK